MIDSEYFWKDGELLIGIDYNLDNRPKECFCVDTYYKDGGFRYGMYIDNTWKSVPIEEFPKEFRMHLLLMGIS